jgi:C-terminal processing protease CtpA/Prc
VLHALGVVPELSHAAFTFENDQGARFTLEVKPVPMPAAVQGSVNITGMVPAARQQPLWRQRPAERFWFTQLPDSTVYVSWRGYAGLGEQARALFRFLDSNPAKRLVIDLRQNGGGDFLEGRKHVIRPLLERAALNQKGRLFVIVGRRTYSAALANAVDFRKQTNAILVGEPIGERPNSYSENDEMTLPNSRLVLSYSTRYYKFVDEDVPAVLPDVRIDPTWPEFLAGRDPVMEWILRQH